MEPKLIEYGTANYMSNILNKCHENRVNIYLYVLNISVFLLFVIIVGFILYYCHKNKMTPYESYEKNRKEQEYILSKIRYYKEHQRNIASKTTAANITGLPMMDERPL